MALELLSCRILGQALRGLEEMQVKVGEGCVKQWVQKTERQQKIREREGEQGQAAQERIQMGQVER